MDDARFHAVKTAALRDAAARYGLRGLEALKRVGRAAFSEHPLPTYVPKGTQLALPGIGGATRLVRGRRGEQLLRATGSGHRAGYGPGVVEQVRDAVRGRQGLGGVARAAGEGAVNTAKTVGHSVGEIARELTLGSPLTFAQQLGARAEREGWSRALGGQVRDFYAPSALNPLRASSLGEAADRAGMLALSAGLPAYQLYEAATGDPATRGEAMGGAMGGLLTAPFTARLGIPGMLIQGAGQQLGARAGRLFDRPTYPSGESPREAPQADALTRQP